MKTKIKICGIKDKEIAGICADLGVDFLGLNFSPVSKRKIDLKIASEIINHLTRRNNGYLKIVALFYKNTQKEIRDIVGSLSVDFIQYVVEDDSIAIDQIKDFNLPLIPQIPIFQQIDDTDLYNYKSEFVILDSHKKGMGGGTGEIFNWEFVQNVKRSYFLAGGLNHQNIKKAIELLSPFGVDIASGVESSPGVKNADLIKKICKEIGK